ncbi:hypothetical protein IAU59_006002 [Kwoniella sp. CBS 9459]
MSVFSSTPRLLRSLTGQVVPSSSRSRSRSLTSLSSRIVSSSRSQAVSRPTAKSSDLKLRNALAVRCNSSSATAASSPSSPPLDEGEKAIYDKLKAAFPGKKLEVQDVSGGCGSFYAIIISSPAFKGLTTIKQHKLVNQCLKEDIKDIHGLQLKTIPEE